ncbi:MAG: glycosyltransferase family 1 protein [Chloroflexi bacterium]|nr:glycosyltransferase family 1 protein [Chloroflexota bacterium]
MRKPLNIALMGTRGVPASYSGFETCVEQLGSRLVKRGHRVTVYARSHHIMYDKPTYRGMRLVKLPTVANKYLDTITHSFLSSLHGLKERYDIALYFIAGNSPVVWIPRLAGQKTIINVDGLDWKREKWPLPAKKYIQLAERLAGPLANAVVTDSRVVQQYYRDVYGIPTTYIAYGAELPTRPPGPTLARFGLEPRKYVLFVGRLVPENCAHHLVEAWQGLETDMKCVIVGDAAYADEYKAQLRSTHDPRVVFTGYVFGEGYWELASNAYAFALTSGVGGTHPALVEAMAFGNCVIVHDTPENLETIGDAGLSYDGQRGSEALRALLQELLQNPDRVAAYRAAAKARAEKYYTWDAVTDAYETLFYDVLAGRRVASFEKFPKA